LVDELVDVDLVVHISNTLYDMKCDGHSLELADVDLGVRSR